jgi:hypothetical protein
LATPIGAGGAVMYPKKRGCVTTVRTRSWLQHHEEAVRDLEELRTAGMNAMGLELTHGRDDGDK